jgi:hypothetical protein
MNNVHYCSTVEDEEKNKSITYTTYTSCGDCSSDISEKDIIGNCSKCNGPVVIMKGQYEYYECLNCHAKKFKKYDKLIDMDDNGQKIAPVFPDTKPNIPSPASPWITPTPAYPKYPSDPHWDFYKWIPSTPIMCKDDNDDPLHYRIVSIC